MSDIAHIYRLSSIQQSPEQPSDIFYD